MIKKKLTGVIFYGIGFALVIFNLFFIFSIFSTFSGAKFFSNLVYIFFNPRFFPPLGMTVLVITMLIFGLFSIFLGSRFFPPLGMTVLVITMLIFGLFSIFLGSRFFLYSWLQFYYKIIQSLVLISGTAFILNSFFLFRLENRARKLAIVFSSILLLYFIPSLFIIIIAMFFQRDPLGGGRIMILSLSSNIVFPLFFILFLNSPKVKEQFKK
jgi:hypothetical protein